MNTTTQPAELPALSDEQIDKHIDAVLRAAGSALRYYTLPKSIADMRSAMRAALAATSAQAQAVQSPAEAHGPTLDEVLRLADEHAEESYENGDRRFDRGGLHQLAKDLLRRFGGEAQPQPKGTGPKVDLRKIAEQAGISMDLWDMGAGSLAYTKGVHGITREHLERFAALYGFSCWNAALEANPPNMQGFVSRAIAEAMGEKA